MGLPHIIDINILHQSSYPEENNSAQLMMWWGFSLMGLLKLVTAVQDRIQNHVY